MSCPSHILKSFPAEKERAGKGSCVARLIGSGGILNAEKGYIVSSFHTIENAEVIFVKLHDNRVFKGNLVGKDKSTDLAIIQIEADKLIASSWSNSDQLQVGDFAVAIESLLV